MPYPETCPECAGPFRNTGTHFTARRQEIGRHVLLELGCQNTSRRYWWDFTQGKLAGGDGRNPADRDLAAAAPVSAKTSTNGHVNDERLSTPVTERREHDAEKAPPPMATTVQATAVTPSEPAEPPVAAVADASPALAQARAAFLRQLELDRLTLRQMRSWLISEEARRAAEVAAGATEAAYERLSLALFGGSLPQLLGRAGTSAPSTELSAEERLELQREKARIRARQRRAALKAARLSESSG